MGITGITLEHPASFLLSPQAARVLLDGSRLQILGELNARPMSPSRFVDEFGGELDHISRCFRELAKGGYLELAEEVVGKGRRGGIEHVYRPIRRRAYFDSHTWKHLPPEARAALSQPTVRAFRARTDEGIQTGTLDRDADRHLCLDTIQLDGAAWTRVMGRLKDIMSSLPGRAATAARRLKANEGEEIPTTLALAGFRSPEATPFAIKPPISNPYLRNRAHGERLLFGQELAHAIRNTSRSRILTELDSKPLSAAQFSRKTGGNPRADRRHFGHLAKWGLIELAEERSSPSGGLEKIYRPKERLDIDDRTWGEIQPFVREELSAFTLKKFWGRVHEAIETETFSREADSHFGWDRCVLDRQGWRELMAELGDCVNWLLVLEQEVADRLDRTGEAPIPTTYFLAGFRAPDPIASGALAGPQP